VTYLGVLNDSCAGYGAAIATDVAVDAAPGGVVAVFVGVGYGDCQGGRMSGNWSCLGPLGLSCPLPKKLGFGPTGTAAPVVVRVSVDNAVKELKDPKTRVANTAVYCILHHLGNPSSASYPQFYNSYCL
jgi:hypothetical protein